MGLYKIIGKIAKATNNFLDNKSLEWEREQKEKENAPKCCANCVFYATHLVTRGSTISYYVCSRDKRMELDDNFRKTHCCSEFYRK